MSALYTCGKVNFPLLEQTHNILRLTRTLSYTAYAPLLLDWKADEKRKAMDVEKGPQKEVKTVYEQGTSRSYVAFSVFPFSEHKDL